MAQDLKTKLAGIPDAPPTPPSKQETKDAVTSIVTDVNEGERNWRSKGTKADRFRNINDPISNLLPADEDDLEDDIDDGSPSWPKRPMKKRKAPTRMTVSPNSSCRGRGPGAG